MALFNQTSVFTLFSMALLHVFPLVLEAHTYPAEVNGGVGAEAKLSQGISQKNITSDFKLQSLKGLRPEKVEKFVYSVTINDTTSVKKKSHNVQLILYPDASDLKIDVVPSEPQLAQPGVPVIFYVFITAPRPGDFNFVEMLVLDGNLLRNTNDENNIPVQVTREGYFDKKLQRFWETNWKWVLGTLAASVAFFYNHGKSARNWLNTIFNFLYRRLGRKRVKKEDKSA